MKYIVLDLEWNVPFSSKNIKHRKNFLRGEVIQFGAVKLDENFRPMDEFEMMVLPKYYKKIEKNISNLTGITDEDVQEGLPFCSVIERFRTWCGNEFVFLTWGTEDIDILRSNILVHKLDDAWLPATFNIQAIYAAQIAKENRQCSLSKAIEQVGESDFKAHDAMNDARSTAIICQHLDMKKGLDEYEQLESSLRWNALESKVSHKTYWKIGQALKDPALTRFRCPVCGEEGWSKEFVSQKNGSKFIGIGGCQNGHEFLVRMKFTRDSNKKYSVIRLIYEMDESNRELYERKKKEAAESYEAYLKYRAAHGYGRINKGKSF